MTFRSLCTFPDAQSKQKGSEVMFALFLPSVPAHTATKLEQILNLFPYNFSLCTGTMRFLKELSKVIHSKTLALETIMQIEISQSEKGIT